MICISRERIRANGKSQRGRQVLSQDNQNEIEKKRKGLISKDGA